MKPSLVIRWDVLATVGAWLIGGMLAYGTLNARISVQADNIAKGVSWTTRSKHLTGDAIDIAPYAVFDIGGRNELQWDSDADVWTQIGAIGESVGLRWGGRWEQRDLGHFEVKA